MLRVEIETEIELKNKQNKVVAILRTIERDGELLFFVDSPKGRPLGYLLGSNCLKFKI